VGLLLDRIRLYVPSWSVNPKLIHDKWLTEIPKILYPDIWDVMIFIGSISLVFLIIIGLSRILPLIGVWEIQQLNLLSKPGKFMKAHGIRVAKPD
jgi:Ni/Fe-hydrogenase subunit HybB-like protein